MAKPRTNLIIEECAKNLLRVWTPAPAKAKGLIEAIEGVVRVCHYVHEGCLHVGLNSCYSKTEIKAEIKAALSKRYEPPFAQSCPPAYKHIADMEVGEVGYVVPWAISDWSGSPDHTLGDLNLTYYVHAKEFGTADTLICRTQTGWVVGGQVFTEPKIKEQVKLRLPPMPYWAEPRSSKWRYLGWIERPPAVGTFEDLVASACGSDYGEICGVDVYPEGATCWVRK